LRLKKEAYSYSPTSVGAKQRLTKPLGPRKIFRGKEEAEERAEERAEEQAEERKNQEQEEPRTGARKTRTRKQQIIGNKKSIASRGELFVEDTHNLNLAIRIFHERRVFEEFSFIIVHKHGL